MDQASKEEELRLLLRQADRLSKMIRKVVDALKRINSGDYGYCRDSGDPIGLQRLLLRPTAELSLESKQRQERREQHYLHVR